MDLWRRAPSALANVALNRYLDHRDETDGLPLLPFFMALRAAIRADVAATRVLETRAMRCEGRGADLFRSRLSVACAATARIVAIGGFSGSGKSSVAAALAPLVAAGAGRASRQ